MAENNLDQVFDKARAIKCLYEFLSILGLNMDDENYKKTPERMVDFFYEFTSFTRDGKKSLQEHFKINFPKHSSTTTSYDGILFQSMIEVYSLCSHHLIPILYNISFAYVPKKNKQIGFSKIVRILSDIAKDPANQEDFTQRIVDTFTNNFDCNGIAVLVSGVHLCMKIRGVHSGVDNKTIAMTGIFCADREMRDRFFELVGSNK